MRLLATIFRFSALLARFLLVFVLAAYLSPADVGLFGLVAATATYAVYVLGMDLYTYTTRELIASDAASWRTKLTSHAAVLCLTSTIAIPVLVGVGTAIAVPWATVGWLVGIAVTEQWALDIDRSLVAISKQFYASVVILIRQAAMPAIVTLFFLVFVPTRSLPFVFGSWVAFNVVAILVGVFLLRRATPIARFRIDWRWAGRGLVVALPFLAGTLLLRLIFTVDRQVVAFYDGLETLGAYTLAITLSGGLSSLIAVGVMQFSYPALVSAVASTAPDEFKRTLRSITIQTAAIAAIAVTAALTLHGWIASWFAEAIYQDTSWAIPFSMTAIAVYNLSLIPHYALYAFRKDRSILAATILSVVAFLTCIIIMIQQHVSSVTTVITAVLCASLVLLLAKGAAFVRVSRNWGWNSPSDSANDLR